MTRCKHERLAWLERPPATPNGKTWTLGCQDCRKPIGTGKGTIHIDIDDANDWTE